jgi:uncharacterized C2H2 Zn-finger protein
MEGRTCEKCGRSFRYPRDLAAHLRRKTPCSPILEQEDLPAAVREDPDLEKKQCRFCGRVFSSYDSMRRHVRKSCGIAPNARNGDAGMTKLYEHTIRQQQAQIEAQRVQIDQLLELSARQGRTVTARGDGTRILQDNSCHQTQVHIHVHGQEGVAHLTEAKVRALLDTASREPELPGAARRAILEAALLVYSDPEHPENLTTFLPDTQKQEDALVHTKDGWGVRPTTQVLPPMARKSVDALFTRQPYENAEGYAPLLKELAANEARYTASADLRAVLERNRELLRRALGGALPAAAGA